MSAVTRQPEGEAQRQAAMQALLSCPTFSIHVRERDRGELRAAQQSFPLPVEGCANVYHCGFHSEHSFGATSYFIQRPQVRFIACQLDGTRCLTSLSTPASPAVSAFCRTACILPSPTH